MNTVVDIRWPLTQPAKVPIHHQYQLLAALSQHVPEIHSLREIGVHSIRGKHVKPGFLEIDERSAITLRTPVDFIIKMLAFGGKKLDIAGCPVRLGVPHLLGLLPSARLKAHLVTIKGYLEEPEFTVGVRRQLDTLGVKASVSVRVGGRRVIRIREQVIVGFELILDGLSDAESVKVQAQGLGGRRHFGCGLFVPWTVRVEP